MSGIDKAVSAAGGRSELADTLGVSVQAIYLWVKRGWVPPARAIELEQRYGIPRVDLVKPSLAALLATATN